MAEAQTRAIYALIRDGKLSDAIGVLQGVLQMSPGSRAALSLLAHCFYHQEEYEAAARTYAGLAHRYRDVPQYQLYWAQSLCKAGLFNEAIRAAAAIEGFPQEVGQLLAAIKYESGDLRGCRAALEAALAAGDPSAGASAGCVLYKEGQYSAAATQFAEAAAAGGGSAELAYALAVCHYRRRDFQASIASLAQIVEAGAQQYPELGIGAQTESQGALSVGNSAKLKQTALVEAFNLRAAIELTMGNPAGAVAALSDMPPRQEHELDPVTLHNRALAGLAHGGPEAAAAALDKLTHLLAHPPFPPELLGNLLSLCCRSTEDSGLGPTAGNGDGTGAIDPKALAEQLLQEHAPLVAAHVPPELLPLYRACLSRSRSAEEAAAQLDAAAGAHVEGLRRGVKTVQEARWAGDQAAAAAGLEAYEQALEAYIPVLMSLAQLHWDAGAYGRVQEVLQQSAEFCSDHPTWRLNLAHALVAQDGGRLGEAEELYESLVQHFAGPSYGHGGDGSNGSGSNGGSLLDVPPSALANLCVCRVVAGQNEVAEELLRRLDDETAAAAAAGQPPTPHLPLTNLAIGTLYCAKGNFEFGIQRVVRSVEPLPGGLDVQRWRGVALCLLCLLDQAAKNMLVLKDGLAADLLGFLEDVEASGAGVSVAGGVCGTEPGGDSDRVGSMQTVAAQARGLRAVLLAMSD
ncbi:hypothetical protein D9Q98_005033 [Chlorella vulgaris]|uniref:Uncharacterized protein n=1 Tax=Chlorella vulgaris TaxID=3077 RepID=A0A9D4YWV0_CHLVU|nr:hypothetical protein D9Q98_005033 [Chlorella vulgaris]